MPSHVCAHRTGQVPRSVRMRLGRGLGGPLVPGAVLRFFEDVVPAIGKAGCK